MIVHFAIWFLASSAINFFGATGLYPFLRDYLMVSPDGVLSGYLWQPFTYMWLHDLGGLGHIFFNLLGLFFLGPPLERRWGARTFLKFYVLTGVIAGVFTVLVGLVLPGWFGGPTLGASGSLLGIIAAFSLVLPRTEILLFFILPIKGRYLIWLALGIDLVLFLATNPATQSIAVHTHFGGALAAWLLITGSWRPRVALARLIRLLGGRRPADRARDKSRFRVIKGGRDDDDDGTPPLLH